MSGKQLAVEVATIGSIVLLPCALYWTIEGVSDWRKHRKRIRKLEIQEREWNLKEKTETLPRPASES